MTKNSVRIATERDTDELLNLLRIWHSEEGLALFHEDAVVFKLRDLLNGSGVVGVIGERGKIQSSISLLLGRVWYTSQNLLESLWTFTLPEYRKSTNTKSLIQFSKKQSTKLSVPLLLDVGSKDHRKILLYERELGPRSGAVWNYKPHSKSDESIGGLKVRAADLSDEKEILDLGREFHAESGNFSKDENNAIPVIHSALSGNGLIGVVGPKAEIQAAIFLQIARYWFSNENLLEEMFLYVRRQYRNSQNAKNLIGFAKSQSDKLDIPFRIGIISKTETEAKIKFYTSLLGHPAGNFFLWNPS